MNMYVYVYAVYVYAGRMYLDGNKRFLLSAKKFGPDLFYISSDENFTSLSKIPEKKYLARIM
jgi:hypothetical protein